jgi:hypothetical protein
LNGHTGGIKVTGGMKRGKANANAGASRGPCVLTHG